MADMSKHDFRVKLVMAVFVEHSSSKLGVCAHMIPYSEITAT